MSEVLRPFLVYNNDMQRDPHSHKTQNGTVAILGGSPLFHGAPIFAALAAEASGVDLVYPVIQASHATVTKGASLNFIVRTYKGESISLQDVKGILLLLRELHTAVIGPGLSDAKQNTEALKKIIAGAKCSLVLDARALRKDVLGALHKGTAVLTPHLGELEHMTGANLSHQPRKKAEELATKCARQYGAVVVLKGSEDFIVDAKGKTKRIRGGNAGLTKGGTGDALAGLIGGLIAQGMEPFEACVTATTIIKRAATVLYPEKGYGFTTRDVIEQIPHLLHTL